MSSELRVVIERLRHAVRTSARRTFDEARSRRPALAEHADMASVLDALASEEEHSYPEREALMQALAAEHRETGRSLWSSALLVAFYPMLSRLRHRLVSDAVPSDELDQVVLTAFLAALSGLTPHEMSDRIAMRLRQRTQRQVFAVLRREREQTHRESEVDEVFTPDMEESAHGRTEDELYDLALLLERAADEGIPRSSLEVVAATVLKRELLRSYVERIAPNDELERERMYQRLKRQRSRVMRKLRDLAKSPAPLPSGF